jgi:Domain of unknown function (DUF4190)
MKGSRVTYPPPPGAPDPYGQQQPHDPTAPPPPPAYDPYGQQQPVSPPPVPPSNPYDPYAQQPSPAPQYSPPPQYGQPYGAVPQYPGYGPQMADPTKQNGLAVASMWTGIGSILLACCCGLFGGLPAGIVAIILGIIGNRQIAERGGQGKGMALTGIITGGVALLIAIGLFIWALSGGQQSLINDILDQTGSGSGFND